MRVAIVADSHFDESSRFEECVRIHHWIADYLRDIGVSAVVHTGDVYERKSTPRERAAVATWVKKVAEFAPLLIIRGNHDAVDDLPLLERLATRHRVIVEQAAGVHDLNGVRVAALAWPRKAALLAASQASGKEQGELAAADALRTVLHGLRAQLSEGSGPTLFAAHAMVRGSVTSTGQPLVGCDMELGLEDLSLVGADAYALGHIHKGQRWAIEGCDPVVYPGSPRRTAFGELEAKGFTILTWDDELGYVRDQFVETPATPMVQLEADWSSEPAGLSVELPPVDQCYGSEFRVRYRVPSDQRDAARVSAAEFRDALLEFGAESVKVEEVVIAETRARAPEIARATTLEEKLFAYWAAKGFYPGARGSKLIAKARELEANHAS